MATIQFVRPSPDALVPGMMSDGKVSKPQPKENNDVGTFLRHPGGPEDLQLIENQLPPGHKAPPHAHAVDEIIVVTHGEIHFGKQVYGVGSSIFIPRLTLYSFAAGPEGLTFLNFRARSDLGTITKDELMARRASKGAADEG